MCACMCRAVPTRKTTAREARPRACVTRAFGSESWRQVPEPVLVPLVVESWRRVPEPALAPLFQEGWRGFPRRTTGAQGHNSLPPEHVSRRLQFVDSGAEPLEFDASTLRLPTSSLQVTTPPNVDFATECCRRGINDGPGYYPDDLNSDGKANYNVGLLSRQVDQILSMIRWVSNRRSGLKEEDLLRLVETCVISRLTYPLPF
ncbi:hypothetical protein HPB51_018494 [Rhipicephalus microplus]|uniref:Uncharacterized protein n=1 Tax=Rhipicephalus microplus TaxID=6941 RepID=A0A9J6EI98_RHIMP|nr:hypothetical protein HPB51_018494 [Rhipicephalus microplus]